MQQFQDQNEPSAPEIHSPAKARRGAGSFVFLGALVLAAVAAWHFWPSASHLPQRQGRDRGGAVTVGTAPVVRGEMPVLLNALGTVTSLATVTVKTQISGKITEIGFTEGQLVTAGDFLAQVDPSPYQSVLSQAEGQLARDQAQLAAARVDQTRYETLMKQDSIARQQVDTQRALVRQNEGTVRADEAAVEVARINLNYCRIVSPINGRAGLRLVDLGNYVQPGDSSGVVVITQTKPISVIFSLPQDTIPQFIAKLRRGDKLPVEALSRDGSQKLATGVLESVDNQIDTTTGTVKLRAMFENGTEELFPNQFVNVKLIVDTLQNATLAPQSAVQLGAPGSYVYVVNPDNTVTVRPVKIGPGNDARVAILDGLSPGDEVVVDGADRLREGASVQVAGVPGTAPRAQDSAGDRGAGNGQNSQPDPSK